MSESCEKTGFTGSSRTTERRTVRVDTVIDQQIQARVETGEFPNYSEGARQLLREGLKHYGGGE